MQAADSPHGVERGEVLPFPVRCVRRGEGEAAPTSKRGAPPGQDHCAGLVSAPAAPASPRAGGRRPRCFCNHCSSTRSSLSEQFHKCNRMSQQVKSSSKWPRATVSRVTSGRSLDLSAHQSPPTSVGTVRRNTQQCEVKPHLQASSWPALGKWSPVTVFVTVTSSSGAGSRRVWQKGRGLKSVSHLLSSLHPNAATSTARGAHLPCFRPPSAMFQLRARYLTLQCFPSPSEECGPSQRLPYRVM